MPQCRLVQTTQTKHNQTELLTFHSLSYLHSLKHVEYFFNCVVLCGGGCFSGSIHKRQCGWTHLQRSIYSKVEKKVISHCSFPPRPQTTRSGMSRMTLASGQVISHPLLSSFLWVRGQRIVVRDSLSWFLVLPVLLPVHWYRLFFLL